MSIRVMIVGDHCWADHVGTIENIPGTTKIEIISVLGTQVVKVKLDNGHECFAENKHLRTLPTPSNQEAGGK